MSIEKVIRKYIKLANDERSRRIMMKKTQPSITDVELKSFEAEYRQIADWLQELKERREKEQRGIECRKPFMTVNVDEDMVQRAVDRTLDSMYMVCDYCGHKMYPKRKEEES